MDFIGHGSAKLEYADFRNLSPARRGGVEIAALTAAAGDIFANMPLSLENRGQYLKNFESYRHKLDWEAVVTDYFLPNLPRASI